MNRALSKSGVSPVILSALWMSGSMASFLVMAVAAREVSSELSTYHILFFRSVIGVILLSVIIHFSGWRQITGARHKIHLWRNLAHYIGQFCWFYGVAVLPMAVVFALEFTTPIWVALLAFVFLKEALNRARILTISLGFLGILVILRPGFAAISTDSMVVMLAAVGFAISLTVTKTLSRTDSVLSILFFMSLIQTPLSLVPCLFDWKWPSAEAWLPVTIVALMGLSAHFCITRAFRHADATVVAPLDFMRLPLAALIGFMLYNESVDIYVLFGATLVFLGNFLGIRAERKRFLQ